ncbi:DUF805 domain-containing protein [Brevibacillus sp. 179-C9.3 HS]|uniref:DUF805 domain-containing protein n=1 Tax=unclassified Brevibacillus TaxID=2684853 RepID=UPI0039A25BDE
MQWYLKVLKNYVAFSGRARRTEYWMFTLFSVIISLVLSFIESMIGIPLLLTGIYSLAILLPTLSVIVRRLHDIGKSGWWFLISFIPLIGSIWLLVLMCQESHGDNQYGANPKSSQSFA